MEETASLKIKKFSHTIYTIAYPRFQEPSNFLVKSNDPGIILAMESFYHHPLGIVAYIARLIQFISAVIVLGITAWAVRDTKTLTVIYSLVVVR